MITIKLKIIQNNCLCNFNNIDLGDAYGEYRRNSIYH